MTSLRAPDVLCVQKTAPLLCTPWDGGRGGAGLRPPTADRAGPRMSRRLRGPRLRNDPITPAAGPSRMCASPPREPVLGKGNAEAEGKQSRDRQTWPRAQDAAFRRGGLPHRALGAHSPSGKTRNRHQSAPSRGPATKAAPEIAGKGPAAESKVTHRREG